MIHCYQNNGYNIVMDVESGGVHVVDELVYRLVPMLEPLFDADQRPECDTVVKAALDLGLSWSEEESAEAAGEIFELADEDMLYTKDIYREAIEAFSSRQPVVKALCLHVAHDCNLACRY